MKTPSQSVGCDEWYTVKIKFIGFFTEQCVDCTDLFGLELR